MAYTDNNWSVNIQPGRTKTGSSLVELLVSVLLMAFVMGEVGLMIVQSFYTQRRTMNKVSTVDAVRTSMERISRVVRQGRNLGDVFGAVVSIPNPPNPPRNVYVGSQNFPSASDALWNGGQVPPGGWPAAPWPAPPYTVGPQCLIVQVPIFDNLGGAPVPPGGNGFPIAILANSRGAGNPIADNTDVDTYVFRVVADPNAAGEYMLQEAMFRGDYSAAVVPAANAPPMRPAINPPSTICKHIIGPMGTNGLPQVFGYIDFTDATHTPRDTAWNGTDPNTVANFTGVRISLEVRNQEADRRSPSTLGASTEVYLRNNNLMSN